jgi:hypothetical protein
MNSKEGKDAPYEAYGGGSGFVDGVFKQGIKRRQTGVAVAPRIGKKELSLLL